MNSANQFFSQSGLLTQYSPFQLLKQTSQSQERISINGIQKLVHVVVKNSAFTVKMGLTSNVWNSQVIDLNNFTFDAILLYDTDVGEKGVDYVKVKPVEFKSVVNDSGDHVNLELRIKVLTSQHENSFFRVKIVMLNPTTGQPFHPAFFILTEPVKVISKPEQMKKKQTPQKKRSVNDMLVDSINRIEQQQQEQQKLIEKLLQQAQTNVSKVQEEKPVATVSESEDCTEFEKAFKRFFQAYNSLPPEEKPVKIRKVVRNSSTRDTERISELLDLFLTEGLQRGNTCDSRAAHGMSECRCETCPYQKELERIDQFYKDFLSVNMLEGNQDNLFFAS